MPHKLAVPVLDNRRDSIQSIYSQGEETRQETNKKQRLGGFMRRGMAWYGKQWMQERTTAATATATANGATNITRNGMNSSARTTNQNRSRFNDNRHSNIQDYTVAEGMYDDDEHEDGDEDGDDETEGEQWVVKVVRNSTNTLLLSRSRKNFTTMKSWKVSSLVGGMQRAIHVVSSH